MKNAKIETLIVQFVNELRPHEVPLFRGAVIAALDEHKSELFHNHRQEGFRYAYPMVQYKLINQQAAIVCVKEGVEAIGQFFATASLAMRLGEREVKLEIDAIRPRTTQMQIWDSAFRYRINRWLPLNSKNFQEYQKIESLGERIAFLERILVGNLLSLAKGVGITFEEQLTCRITSLSQPYTLRHKQTSLLSYNIEFTTNLSLPEYIGLGKNAALGYGVVTRRRDRNDNQ